MFYFKLLQRFLRSQFHSFYFDYTESSNNTHSQHVEVAFLCAYVVKNQEEPGTLDGQPLPSHVSARN